MTLKLTMTASDETKTTRNISNVDNSKEDVTLKNFANAYFALTDAVIKKAEKVVTTEVALS